MSVDGPVTSGSVLKKNCCGSGGGGDVTVDIDVDALADAITTAIGEGLDVTVDLTALTEAIQGCLTVGNCLDADGNPVPVTVDVANFPAQIQIETVCINGTWHYVSFIDGVAQPDPVDSGVDCSAPVPGTAGPDLEAVEECREDTLWTVWYSPDPVTGLPVEVEAVDTGRVCSQTVEVAPQDVERCVKWSTTVVNVDNSKTQFGADAEVEVTQECGTVVVEPLPASAGWTAQVDAISALFSGLYPEANIDSRCNKPAGCGNLLPPPADAPTSKMFARYTSMVFCPTEVCMPTRVRWRPVGGSWVDLVIEVIETPEQRGFECGPVCGEKTLYQGYDENGDGIPVPEADLPACVFDCAETIPAAPEPVCPTDVVEGCDEVDGVRTPIIRTVTTCPGEPFELLYWIENEFEALVPHTLVGVFVDCVSGEPIPGPETPAAADCCTRFKCVEVVTVGENGAVCPGPEYEVEIDADGNVVKWILGIQEIADPTATLEAGTFQVMPCGGNYSEVPATHPVEVFYDLNGVKGITKNVLGTAETPATVTLTDVCCLTVAPLSTLNCEPGEMPCTAVTFVDAIGNEQTQYVYPGQTAEFGCAGDVTVEGYAILSATTSVEMPVPQGEC